MGGGQPQHRRSRHSEGQRRTLLWLLKNQTQQNKRKNEKSDPLFNAARMYKIPNLLHKIKNKKLKPL
jgi:hypothetical protein